MSGTQPEFQGNLRPSTQTSALTAAAISAESLIAAETFHTDDSGIVTIELRCLVDGEPFLFGLGGTGTVRTPFVHVEVSKSGYLNRALLHEFDRPIRIRNIDLESLRNELEVRLIPASFSEDLRHEK